MYKLDYFASLSRKMARQQRKEYDLSNANATRQGRRSSLLPFDDLGALICVPQVYRPPMDLAHDDPDNGTTLDRGSFHLVFQSMRDIHEFMEKSMVDVLIPKVPSISHRLVSRQIDWPILPPSPAAWMYRNAHLHAQSRNIAAH